MTTDAPGVHPLPEEVDALLDPAGGDVRVEAHVAGCGHCRQVRDGLRQVRALLGRQARELPPEPPDLGARIAAALAAEPPLRAQVDGSGAGVEQDAPVVPLPRRRPATTWLAVAASVAVVGLGGTFLGTRLDAVGGGDAEAVAESSGGAEQEAAGGLEGGSAGGGASAPTPAAGGLLGSDDGERSSSGGTLTDLQATGTAYTRASLAAQAQALVAAAPDLQDTRATTGPGDPVGPAGPGVSGQDADPLPSLSDRLERCLVAVGRRGADPRAADVATFEGEPATVLLLPDAGGYEVVVVPRACGDGDDRVLATTRLE